MYNNQNDNSKSKWCPNVFFEKGNVSIGEFKTLDDAMGFPIPDKWCVNRTVGDNKFEKYMALNVRVLIICDWSKSIQDSRKFVIALVYPDGQTIYFDFNDIQIDANEYETSLDEDVFNAIERVVSAHYKLHNSETNENKQYKTRYNMKKTIRLSESDLQRIVNESVKRIVREGFESERESHDKMWSLIDDAYNQCLNITEGGDMYVKAFDETIFPLLQKIDSQLGWQ